MKIYVAVAEALTNKEIQDETQFGSSLFRFVKFSFPVTRLMPCYVETRSSCPLIAGLYRELYCGLHEFVSLNLKNKFVSMRFIFLLINLGLPPPSPFDKHA